MFILPRACNRNAQSKDRAQSKDMQRRWTGVREAGPPIRVQEARRCDRTLDYGKRFTTGRRRTASMVERLVVEATWRTGKASRNEMD